MTGTTGARKRRLRDRSTNRFRYREQYGVIIVCRGEAHQRIIYRRMRRQGHTRKVVVV